MSSAASLQSPLEGELINSVSALKDMKVIVSSLRATDIVIVSAYMKLAGLRELLSQVDPSNRIAILVRWQANDLLMGASDLESYAFAKTQQWDFYARQDLHAKIYCLGQTAIYMGSANLTTMGFSLTGHGNAEAMVRVQASTGNIAHVVSLFAGAVKMTDPMVADMQRWIESQPVEKPPSRTWPPDLALTLAPPRKIEHLMTSECFASDGTALFGRAGGLGDEVVRDLSLLAIPDIPDQFPATDLLVKSFTESKMFRWLGYALAQQYSRELYFGAASALLQSALLDDPRPYRQEVKTLLANLLNWIALCPGCGVVVDRPNHSQRIRLA